MVKFNDYYNEQRCMTRLLDDFLKHGTLVIAFDFDNTIYDYHEIGCTFNDVICLLKECSELGFTMVLFTANEGKEKLDFCKEYCLKKGIRVDYINESPIMQTRKPYYNILLDDRAGLEESYKTLKKVITIIKANICKS